MATLTEPIVIALKDVEKNLLEHQHRIGATIAAVQQSIKALEGMAVSIPSYASAVSSRGLDTAAMIRKVDAVKQTPPTVEIPPEYIPPTEEEKRALITESIENMYKKEELLHYTGAGSIFARFFSSSLIEYGRGILKPTSDGAAEDTEVLLQFNEDISVVPVFVLESWPTGFYRSDKTKEIQFFVHLGDKTALIINPITTKKPIVSLIDFSTSSENLITDFSIEKLQALRVTLEQKLKTLSGI